MPESVLERLTLQLGQIQRADTGYLLLTNGGLMVKGPSILDCLERAESWANGEVNSMMLKLIEEENVKVS